MYMKKKKKNNYFVKYILVVYRFEDGSKFILIN